MSVTGEFKRLANDCIELLESNESEAAHAWASRLHAARAIATRDLSEAAQRVQSLDAGAERISEVGFASAADSGRFRERCEHLLAIARAITGGQ